MLILRSLPFNISKISRMNLSVHMGIRSKLLQDPMLLSNSVSHFIIFLLISFFLFQLLHVFNRDLVLYSLDTFIQKTKKLYQDTRTQRNISKLNDELYEVHQIMTRNVQEVLGVGEKLDRKWLRVKLSIQSRLNLYLMSIMFHYH